MAFVMNYNFYLIIIQPNQNQNKQKTTSDCIMQNSLLTEETYGMRIRFIPVNLSMSCYLDKIAPRVILFSLHIECSFKSCSLLKLKLRLVSIS